MLVHKFEDKTIACYHNGYGVALLDLNSLEYIKQNIKTTTSIKSFTPKQGQNLVYTLSFDSNEVVTIKEYNYLLEPLN